MDTDPPISLETEIPGAEFAPALGKVFLSLLFLIGLLILTFWILKRLIHGRTKTANANQLIQIVEKRVLSPKTVLYVISIEGQKHVIAESQLEIKAITQTGNPFESHRRQSAHLPHEE